MIVLQLLLMPEVQGLLPGHVVSRLCWVLWMFHAHVHAVDSRGKGVSLSLPSLHLNFLVETSVQSGRVQHLCQPCPLLRLKWQVCTFPCNHVNFYGTHVPGISGFAVNQEPKAGRRAFHYLALHRPHAMTFSCCISAPGQGIYHLVLPYMVLPRNATSSMLPQSPSPLLPAPHRHQGIISSYRIFRLFGLLKFFIMNGCWRLSNVFLHLLRCLLYSINLLT